MLTRPLLDGEFKHSGIRKDSGLQFERQRNTASEKSQKSALKKWIDFCEWVLFLVLYVGLLGGMLVYGFQFLVG